MSLPALDRCHSIVSGSRLVAAVGFFALLVTLVTGSGTAQAQRHTEEVALVPDRAGEECCAGALPTKGSVHGVPADSFGDFHFTNLPVAGISSNGLAEFDTVVLNQVNVGSLGNSERLALSEFVTEGGKLIIRDADATSGNDYSWLPSSAHTHTVCGLCGSGSGSSKIITNTTLASKETVSPYYINVSQIDSMTDAADDANILVEDDGTWFKDIELVNAVAQKDKAIQAYAAVGHGLMLYNGYDSDYMGIPEEPGEVDWLAKLWYQELDQDWNPDNLPRPHDLIVYYPNDPYAFRFRLLPPVEEPPRLNKVRAGRAVPVRFGLGSNAGLDIFATGFPKSGPIACADPGRALGPALPAVSPGGWSLRFNRTAHIYTFRWKTKGRWAGSCRRLILTLADGTTHTAKFYFR